MQYPAIRYTERLTEAGIEPSVGSVGDSYDNALAESIIGLYKTEVIEHLGPWNSIVAVEIETLGWVDWFNNRRLLEPIGYLPPAEFEELHYETQEGPAIVAGLKQHSLRKGRGGSWELLCNSLSVATSSGFRAAEIGEHMTVSEESRGRSTQLLARETPDSVLRLQDSSFASKVPSD